jgi:glycerate dehydrogenase
MPISDTFKAMRIVITDGYTLNPGDLDWSEISSFGQVDYYDTTPKEMVPERCVDADIIITNKTVIPAEVIAAAKRLKMVAVSATGYNNVDIQAARHAGVVVSNVPEYGTWSVAQHTFALLLELVNHVGINSTSARNDEWAKSGQWSYTKRPIVELKDKVLGIVGYGRIGARVGEIGAAVGMRVIFSNRSKKPGNQVDIAELFEKSDVVSLHCPLTKENEGFINYALLSKMKNRAFLINTSRGQLINEKDLVKALDDHLLAGAALDVLKEEPPVTGHPLVHHPRVIITPHNAWVSVEARSRMMQLTAENIRMFLAGTPINVVNA